MTDLLPALDAAAALGKLATARPWQGNAWIITASAEHTGDGVYEICRFMRMKGQPAEANHDYVLAACSLDLAAVAAEMRAKDAEIERLRKVCDAVDKMAATEEAGGSDWWRAWDGVKCAVARAKKPTGCGATCETESGEYVSPCHKPKGHGGQHEGYCLGSRAVWTDDAALTPPGDGR